MRDAFQKYTKNTKVVQVVAEKKEPDFVFYEALKATMFVYSVKPAVFDLVLTAAIVVYLGAIYLVIQKFSIIYNVACGLTAKPKRA